VTKNPMKIMPPQLREQWGIARLFEKCNMVGDLYEKIDFCVGYLFKCRGILCC